MKKRTGIAVLAALLVFGGVLAMAASLGGITSTKVGADNTALASCDTDGVSTSYSTAWDATDDRYEISTVTVSGVADACDTQTLSVSLTNTAGDQIGSGSVVAIDTDVATSFDVSLSTHASAELSTGVHVLIAS
jgi:hypothetical protein